MTKSKSCLYDVDPSTHKPVCGHPVSIFHYSDDRDTAYCRICMHEAMDDFYWECIKMEITRPGIRESQRRAERNKKLDSMERVCVVCHPKLDE